MWFPPFYAAYLDVWNRAWMQSWSQACRLWGLSPEMLAQAGPDSKLLKKVVSFQKKVIKAHAVVADATKKDSDGDGTADGDWNERREYAYSVRTVLRYLPPFDEKGLNDDFQELLDELE